MTINRRFGMIKGMTAAKIAITIDPKLLRKVDSLVSNRLFKSRSHAIQTAVADQIEGMGESRLARECAKLDPVDEAKWAELGIAEDSKSWPKF